MNVENRERAIATMIEIIYIGNELTRGNDNVRQRERWKVRRAIARGGESMRMLCAASAYAGHLPLPLIMHVCLPYAERRRTGWTEDTDGDERGG